LALLLLFAVPAVSAPVLPEDDDTIADVDPVETDGQTATAEVEEQTEPVATEEQAAPAVTEEQTKAVEKLEAQKAWEEAVQSIPNRPIPEKGFPWIEHNGYFRLRMDGFYRANLGTSAYDDQLQKTLNSSAVPPPITGNYINKGKYSSEQWISSMNMRFRYAPTLHVMKNMAIVSQFDILDNMVLGSTPDFDPDRPDAPLPFFARSQIPSEDSVRVKQAYMVWSPWNPDNTKDFLFSISAGRMARQWGLGIMENDGENLDADFGTYVDRANVLLRYWNVYLELGFGWTATGATSANAVESYGQPYDLTNSDNVYDFTVAIFQKPLTASGRLERASRLVRGKPVFDWGVYLKYRWQKNDAKQTMDGDFTTTTTPDYDNYALENRSAWSISPDIWLKLEWKRTSKERLRVELEASGVFGRIDKSPRFSLNSDGDWVADGYQELNIRSWAVALEAEYQWGAVNVGLKTGVASGTDAEYWGWQDQNNVATSKNLKSLNSFYFHPDYRIDELLFRQTIGTVTNAFYIKPWFMYDFFESRKDSLAVGAGFIYGRALEAKATPGNSSDLGIEVDVNLLYETAGMFFAGITWATLVPFGGMDLAKDYGCNSFDADGSCRTARAEVLDANWAMSIRGVFGVRF
jgi:uncharacterized protein (TIGR04551 family)